MSCLNVHLKSLLLEFKKMWLYLLLLELIVLDFKFFIIIKNNKLVFLSLVVDSHPIITKHMKKDRSSSKSRAPVSVEQQGCKKLFQDNVNMCFICQIHLCGLQ